MEHLRYTVVFEFVGKFSSTFWEEKCKTIKEVSVIASMVDNTVLSAKVIDNVTGKTIQKLR